LYKLNQLHTKLKLYEMGCYVRIALTRPSRFLGLALNVACKTNDFVLGGGLA